MIWVKGEIVADEALTISALDRTFEHGLGLFETLRTWGGSWGNGNWDRSCCERNVN